MTQSFPHILLAICPPWDIDLPPIQLAYLLSTLRSQGISAIGLDLNIDLYHQLSHGPCANLWDVQSVNQISIHQMTDALLGAEPHWIEHTVEKILSTQATLIGFSLHMRNVLFTEHLVQMIKKREPQKIIIYGGPDVAAQLFMDSLKNLSADAFVVGEGELTLLEIMNTYLKKGKLLPIPGLIIKNPDKTLTELVPRKPVRNLDLFPFPEYSDFDLKKYRLGQKRVLPFLFSRGCVSRCAFCQDHVLSGKFRMRSAKNAVSEIKQLIDNYHCSHLQLNDLLCNGDLNKLETFCDELIAQNLNIYWSSNCMIRKEMTEDLFKKMKQSGCLSLVFGLESGSNKVLRLMNKNYTRQIAAENIYNASKTGIYTNINIIVGFPGESDIEHRETLSFLKTHASYYHAISSLAMMALSPGSHVISNPKQFGIQYNEKGSWYSDDGNAYEQRYQRLKEVKSLAAEMNKPVLMVSLDVGEHNQFQICDLSDEIEFRIVDVKLNDNNLCHGLSFKPGERMIISLKYTLNKPLDQYVARIQFFTAHKSAQPLFCFGTNTNRFFSKVPVLPAGTGVIQLILYQLNFAPGIYSVTVGFWPTEESPFAYDVHHGRVTFNVKGESNSITGIALIPHEWRLISEKDADSNEPTKIASIEIRGKDNQPKTHYSSCEKLIVRINYNVNEVNVYYVIVHINHEQHLIHQAKYPYSLKAGQGIMELSYQTLCLLEGDYSIDVILMNETKQNIHFSQSQTFHIQSEVYEGAGIVFHPVAWRILADPECA